MFRVSIFCLGLFMVKGELAVGAGSTGTMDMAVVGEAAGQVTRVHGHNNVGQSGVPVCGGFDCDGDGFKDSAIALFRSTPLSNFDAGQVVLVFGDGTIGGKLDTEPFNPNMLKIAGEAALEYTGSEVWMDDVTGDGLGDLLIARQNYTPEVGREGAGAVSILVGGSWLRSHAATSSYLELGSPPAGAQIVTISGVSAYDRFGIWLRTGDITGDGVADLLVGADQTDEEGSGVGDNNGAAWVIRGGAHLAGAGATVNLSDFGSTSLKGHMALVLPPTSILRQHFGATCAVGDLDGNGRAEVVVASTLSRSGASLTLGGTPAGASQASGGTPSGTVFISWDENFPLGVWPDAYTFEVTDPPIGDFTRIDGGDLGGGVSHLKFGEEIVAGGDYNGDGWPDLFVGDLRGVTPNGADSGIGNVFYTAARLRGKSFGMGSPPSDVRFTTIWGVLAGAISADTVMPGDFDGDGYTDIGIGNPHDAPQGRTHAGSIHVIYGQAGKWPSTIDLSAGNLPSAEDARIYYVEGLETQTVLCYSAASGDLNADGRDDLIVNEMRGDSYDDTVPDVGNMLHISGAAMLAPLSSELTLIPAVLDFSKQAVGSTSSSLSLVLRNDGVSSVNLESLSLEGPEAANYTITSDSGEASLGAGASRTLTLTFAPDIEGFFGAGVVIKTDEEVNSFGVPLKGVGVAPELVPEITSCQIVNSGFELLFQSQLGYTYEVRRDTVLPVAGSPVETGIMGTGAPVSFYDVSPLVSRRFYTVGVSP